MWFTLPATASNYRDTFKHSKSIYIYRSSTTSLVHGSFKEKKNYMKKRKKKKNIILIVTWGKIIIKNEILLGK